MDRAVAQIIILHTTWYLCRGTRWHTQQEKTISESDSGAAKASVDPFELVTKIKSRGPAPVHLWDPPFCGDMDMLIARDGSWIHEGRPIRRAAMVRLFASVLKLEENGDYYLVTPVEKVRIRVEDCPFVATAMDTVGDGQSQSIVFTTNTGETVTADSDHPIVVEADTATGEPHPTIHVRSGLHALINRPVFYRLVALAEQSESDSEIVTGVWSNNAFFELGRQPQASSNLPPQHSQ